MRDQQLPTTQVPESEMTLLELVAWLRHQGVAERLLLTLQ